MKDIGHHMTRFIRKIIKEEPSMDPNLQHEYFEKPHSKEQMRKQKKIQIKKSREAHIPEHDSVEVANHKMKKRWPIMKNRAHPTKI